MNEKDPRFHKGIDHFNKGEYYDAHEVWEDLWHEPLGDSSGFVQGLIQFATALHHFRAKNLKGTKLLYDGGMELLKPYGSIFWGVLLEDLTADMTTCVKEIIDVPYQNLPGRYDPNKDAYPVKLDPAQAPRIKLSPSL